MPLRVGCVEYLNALPFCLPFQMGLIETDIEFTYAIPSQLNALLRQQQLDVALTSTVEYFNGAYGMLPDMGIACEKCVLSVNLYSQFPTQSLHQKRIGVTHHSATSILLLKVLCKYLWKVSPKFELLNRQKPFSYYDAFLLIGDEALNHITPSHFQIIDLGSAWYELTALPFVFALFSFSSKNDTKQMDSLRLKLQEALSWSFEHRNFLENWASFKSFLSADLIKKYFSSLHYHLGKKEKEALMLFKTMSAGVTHVPTIFP